MDCGGDSCDCYQFPCEDGYARELAAGYQMFKWRERCDRWRKVWRRSEERPITHWHRDVWAWSMVAISQCKEIHKAWYKWGRKEAW